MISYGLNPSNDGALFLFMIVTYSPPLYVTLSHENVTQLMAHSASLLLLAPSLGEMYYRLMDTNRDRGEMQ